MPRLVSQTGALPAQPQPGTIALVAAQAAPATGVVQCVNPHVADVDWDRAAASLAICQRWLGSARGWPDLQAMQGVAHHIHIDVIDPFRIGQAEARLVLGELSPGERLNVVVRDGARGWGFLCELRMHGFDANAVALERAENRALAGATLPFLRMGRPRGGADVVLAELFTNRLRMMQPLVEALREGGKRVVVMSLAKGRSDWRAHAQLADSWGVEATHWTSWLGPATARSGLRYVLATARACGHRAMAAELPALAWMEPSERRQLRGALLRAASVSGALREVFRRVLVETGARTLLTARGDGSTLRAMAAAASETGGRVVDVQHGVHGMVGPTRVSWMDGVHFMLASPHTVRSYQRAGVPDAQLHQVGSLVFDQILNAASAPPTGYEPFVLYSSNAVELYSIWSALSHHRAMLRALDDYLSEHPGVRVVVKAHPQEREGLTASMVAELAHGSRFVVVREASNVQLMQHALAHLSFGSTTSVEAALLGCPCVVVRLASANPYFEEGHDLGAWTLVSSVGHVGEVLPRIAGRRRDPSIVARAYAYASDGQTGSRIATWICDDTALGEPR